MNPFEKWRKKPSSMGVTCKCLWQELDMFKKEKECRWPWGAESGTAVPKGPHGGDPMMKHLICHSKMFRSYPI